MNDEHKSESTDPEMAGSPSGDAFPVRHEGRLDGTPSAGADAASEEGRKPERNPLEGIDFEQVRQDPILLAQVTAYLQENHLHLPILTPDRQEMAAMREQTPELYNLYVTGLQKSVDADFIQRTYPYTEPMKNVRSGRRYGLVAVLGVLCLAGYALYLDLPWFAGVITAIDVIGLAAVFGSDSGSKNTGGNE